MHLEHNEEVQLITPLHMWSRWRCVRLGAEEGHQCGPEMYQLLGTATEKTGLRSISQAWAYAEVQGLRGGLPNWAKDRHRHGDQGII